MEADQTQLFVFFLVFFFQQRSWLQLLQKLHTAKLEPCLTSQLVSHRLSACHPLLLAPPLHTVLGTHRVTPPSVPRVRLHRWPAPHPSLLHPRWLGLSPKPGQSPNLPGRGPIYHLLNPPPRQAPAHSLWTTRRVCWMVCLLGKVCPQVRFLNLAKPSLVTI